MKRAEFYALKDRLQAIDEVAEIIEGHDRAAYERDFRVHRVVERCVEIVSEACRRVSGELGGHLSRTLNRSSDRTDPDPSFRTDLTCKPRTGIHLIPKACLGNHQSRQAFPLPLLSLSKL